MKAKPTSEDIQRKYLKKNSFDAMSRKLIQADNNSNKSGEKNSDQSYEDGDMHSEINPNNKLNTIFQASEKYGITTNYRRKSNLSSGIKDKTTDNRKTHFYNGTNSKQYTKTPAKHSLEIGEEGNLHDSNISINKENLKGSQGCVINLNLQTPQIRNPMRA